MLGVARLVDLLGEQERLLVLVLGRQHEPRELAGDPLLADEERRQPAQHLLAQRPRPSPPSRGGRGSRSIWCEAQFCRSHRRYSSSGVISFTCGSLDSSVIVATSPWTVRSSRLDKVGPPMLAAGLRATLIQRPSASVENSGMACDWLLIDGSSLIFRAYYGARPTRAVPADCRQRDRWLSRPPGAADRPAPAAPPGDRRRLGVAAAVAGGADRDLQGPPRRRAGASRAGAADPGDPRAARGHRDRRRRCRRLRGRGRDRHLDAARRRDRRDRQR